MDEFYKIVFAFPRMVRDLVRGFLPKEWTDDLDLDRLELLPTAYVSDGWHKRYGDRVWKIPYREGPELPPGAYAVLLLEFQSEVDATMPVRMLVYTGLLLQELLRQREGLSTDLKLPRTMPVLIYNGRQHWSAPLSVTATTLPGRAETADFQPRLSYWALDQWRLSPEDLVEGNLVSSLVAVETGDGESLDQAIAVLASLLADPIDHQIRRAFRDWLDRLKSPRVMASGRTLATILMEEPMTLLERVNEKLERWYDELERQATERGMAQGMAQGMARGMARGIEEGTTRTREQLLAEERELLRRMAERRFGSEVAGQVAAMLAETDDNEGFAAVGDAIVDSETGRELLQRVSAGR